MAKDLSLYEEWKKFFPNTRWAHNSQPETWPKMEVEKLRRKWHHVIISSAQTYPTESAYYGSIFNSGMFRLWAGESFSFCELYLSAL